MIFKRFSSSCTSIKYKDSECGKPNFLAFNFRYSRFKFPCSFIYKIVWIYSGIVICYYLLHSEHKDQFLELMDPSFQRLRFKRTKCPCSLSLRFTMILHRLKPIPIINSTWEKTKLKNSMPAKHFSFLRIHFPWNFEWICVWNDSQSIKDFNTLILFLPSDKTRIVELHLMVYRITSLKFNFRYSAA